MFLFTSKQLYELETDYAKAENLEKEELMARAARGMYEALRQTDIDGKRLAFLCGGGNNAGDGYALASLFTRVGFPTVCLIQDDIIPTREPAYTFYKKYLAAGGKVLNRPEDIYYELLHADVIIDAVFGIGFHGELDECEPMTDYIRFANERKALRVALDVPSGVSADDGKVGTTAFCADRTLTVTACKPGLVSYPGRAYAGDVTLISIGIPSEMLENKKTSFLLPDDEYVRYVLPERLPDAHKGDHGKVLCVCGSPVMTGAAVLSAKAAVRAGAGLVTVASEKPVTDCVAAHLAEPVYRVIDWTDQAALSSLCDDADHFSAILVGCGLGVSNAKRDFVLRLLREAKTQIVLDADGINLLRGHIHVLKEAFRPPILTPHPGEFARLTGKDAALVNADRITNALAFSKENRCITVLKGASTLITDHNGRLAVNTTGTPGLAKGGSGDVLAGLIAGLAANVRVKAFEAAVCGAYLHGKAAERTQSALSAYGMIPSDLFTELAKLLP